MTAPSGWDWTRGWGWSDTDTHPRPHRSRTLTAEILHLTRALKAPLRDSVDRLAERVHAESWTHEEYLVACLQT